MPRYVVERTFPAGLDIPAGREGAELCRNVVDRNADEGVTWVHSYVSEDRKRTFCVYDAGSPEAIRKTASRNGLPVERITQVRVLDPYSYAPVQEHSGGHEQPDPATRSTQEVTVTEKEDKRQDRDELELEPEAVQDLEASEDEVDKVRGGCFGTHGQLGERH